MEVILESIVGSTAYGLATESSDVDRLGIYVEPTKNLTGLKLWTERDFTTVYGKPDHEDRTLHEVGKFARLALQCNPTVTELLWVPERLLVTNSVAGQALRNHKMSFLTADKVRSAYMGYATSQFNKIERHFVEGEEKKRTKKHARHLLRLMHQGYTLYTTGELPIDLGDTAWRYHEFGEMVAFHYGHASQTVKTYERMFEEATPAVPLSADTDKVDRIIKWIREGY